MSEVKLLSDSVLIIYGKGRKRKEVYLPLDQDSRKRRLYIVNLPDLIPVQLLLNSPIITRLDDDFLCDIVLGEKYWRLIRLRK